MPMLPFLVLGALYFLSRGAKAFPRPDPLILNLGKVPVSISDIGQSLRTSAGKYYHITLSVPKATVSAITRFAVEIEKDNPSMSIERIRSEPLGSRTLIVVTFRAIKPLILTVGDTVEVGSATPATIHAIQDLGWQI